MFKQKIISAIRDKSLIKFLYDGKNRIVEPYCYGQLNSGSIGVRAFQVQGSSASNELGWKIFKEEKMTGVVILDETFGAVREGYKTNDKAFDNIYAQL